MHTQSSIHMSILKHYIFSICKERRKEHILLQTTKSTTEAVNNHLILS